MSGRNVITAVASVSELQWIPVKSMVIITRIMHHYNKIVLTDLFAYDKYNSANEFIVLLLEK